MCLLAVCGVVLCTLRRGSWVVGRGFVGLPCPQPHPPLPHGLTAAAARLVQAANDVDFFTVGLYFAVLLGAGYFVMSKKSTASGAKAAKPAKKVETGTKDTIGNEWLAGTHATPKKKKN